MVELASYQQANFLSEGDETTEDHYVPMSMISGSRENDVAQEKCSISASPTDLGESISRRSSSSRGAMSHDDEFLTETANLLAEARGKVLSIRHRQGSTGDTGPSSDSTEGK